MRESIAALRFGPYAREEGSLAVVSVSGKLSIFMLHRKAVLGASSKSGEGAAPTGRPPEQDIPLKVNIGRVLVRRWWRLVASLTAHGTNSVTLVAGISTSNGDFFGTFFVGDNTSLITCDQVQTG